MYKILLHIGLPKTATTSLQCNVLYPLHIQKEINFLGRYLESIDVEFYNPIGDIICQLDEEKTDKEILELRKELYSLLDFSRLNVISEECISLTHNEKHLIRFHNVSKLLEECDVTVLLSLRNPVDFMFSYYVEMYKWYYHSVKDSNTFEKFALRLIENPEKGEFDILFFNRFIKLLSCYFSKVELLFFEDIKNNPDGYFQQLSDVLFFDKQDVSRMFSEKKRNIRKKTPNSKKSEIPTLTVKIRSLVEPVNKALKSTPLRNNKLIKYLYHRILLQASKIPIGKPVEHTYPNQQTLGVLQGLLRFEDKRFCGLDGKK